MIARVLLAVVSVGVLAGGCGQAASTVRTAGTGHTTHVRATHVVRASAPATLPASAVPYLPSSATTLPPARLAREAQDRTLAGKLRTWGYQVGRQRTFQGSSRDLQLVDSRTLRFRDAAGASAFVAFTRRHADAYLGSFPAIRSYSAHGRRGFLVTGQACRCHLANPALLAVVARGGTVTWLEINGPKATPHRLTRLLARAP